MHSVIVAGRAVLRLSGGPPFWWLPVEGRDDERCGRFRTWLTFGAGGSAVAPGADARRPPGRYRQLQRSKSDGGQGLQPLADGVEQDLGAELGPDGDQGLVPDGRGDDRPPAETPAAGGWSTPSSSGWRNCQLEADPKHPPGVLRGARPASRARRHEDAPSPPFRRRPVIRDISMCVSTTSGRRSRDLRQPSPPCTHDLDVRLGRSTRGQPFPTGRQPARSTTHPSLAASSPLVAVALVAGLCPRPAVGCVGDVGPAEGAHLAPSASQP